MKIYISFVSLRESRGTQKGKLKEPVPSLGVELERTAKYIEFIHPSRRLFVAPQDEGEPFGSE
jgi:hypothetical protein